MALRQEIRQEIDRFVTRALRDQERRGPLDLEALQRAIRSSLHQVEEGLGVVLAGRVRTTP